MKRYLSLIASAMLFLFLYTGCGASGGSVDSNAPMEGAMAEEVYEANDKLTASAQSNETRLPEKRKWVITSEVRAETENMDKTVEAVMEKVSALSGYVEDQNFENGSIYGDYEQNRSARMTVRVPVENIDVFMEAVKQQANVVSSSRNLEDITLRYADTETRIAALKAEEARLLEFMEQAETMADLLEIERRLTDVHYELENVTSRLRTYDNQINYATIHLTLEEVREYTPVEEPGFLERISTGFVASVKGVWKGLENLTVLLIVASPYLIVWGLIIFVILMIVRFCVRKKEKKGKKIAAGKTSPVSKEIPDSWKNFSAPKKEEPPKEEKK